MEVLKRDCDAVLIPAGTKITIPAGTRVTITQALGGSYTVNIQGNLARIDGKDADALGLTPTASNDDSNAAGGPVDEKQVWAVLKTCYDPEIPTNIVDLGLVYECIIAPIDGGGNRVNVRMTLTAPGCGMGPFIVEDVRNKVLTVPNVTEANIELVFDPPWDQSMMSEEAKLRTGMMW